MDSFSIRFEWEQSPGARVAEHDATWARLEIRAADEPITRVEVTRTESLRTAIYVPLYPLAEWIASNWWPLWEEWGTSQSRARHCLLAAKEGFALPDLTIAPTETKVRLVWRPSACLTEGIAFLSAGECVLDKLMVKEQFRALVDAVLERLELRGAPDLRLAQYWRTVQDSEGDPEQRAFCANAARLGYDPFDIDDAAAARIEDLDALLPHSVVPELCGALSARDLASGVDAVNSFIGAAETLSPAAGEWALLRRGIMNHSGLPWRDGYNDAIALRSSLHVEGPVSDLEALLASTLGSCEVKPFNPPRAITAISAPASTGSPVFGLPPSRRPDSRRFALCRSLGDFIASPQPALVTQSNTERQQRGRAFAAEFLAPAELIRERIEGQRVCFDDIDDLAAHFQVSADVIRLQIRNHGLASIDTF